MPFASNVPRNDLTVEFVRNLFDLDSDRGVLLWRNPCGNNVARLIGRVAGSIQNSGYIGIKVCGRLYLAHRLIWLHVHGEWPRADLDHADCIKTNNRPDNLREATRSQNVANTPARANASSGLKGICLEKATGRWRAAIAPAGKTKMLGRFDTPEEANGAYKKAAQEIFGEFAQS